MNNIIVFYDLEEKQFDEDQFTPLRNYAYPIVGFEEEKKRIKYKFMSHNHQIEELEEKDLLKRFKFACICQVQNWE